MTKLEELIEKLCPDGVEYKEINDCTIKVQNIKWKSYVGEDKQYIDLSSVDRERNIITETQNINADTAPSRAQQIVMKDDIIFGTTRPMLKRYCIIPEKYDGEICSTGFCVLRAKTAIINPRWLYHNITTNNFFSYVEQNQQGASYPAISDTIVKAFKLPVPPLEVQREIVRILDNFTFLTTELAARQKQYEYYRDLLLNFDVHAGGTNAYSIPWLAEMLHELCPDGVEYKKLEKLCCIKTGKLNANAMVPKGKYPFFTCDSKPYRINDYAFDADAILISGNGSQVGHLHKYNGKFNAYQRTYVLLDFSDGILKDFMYIFLKSSLKNYILINSKKGSVPYITLPMLCNFKLPIPPLAVQQRIVNILDRFDTLCNDISSGLPAEIEARQKQYEYYRDKLLTFKELKKEA